MNDIEGVELACVSTNESDTIYRLFRKEGRVWVRVWIHFRPRLEGMKKASSEEIEADRFASVEIAHGKTLKAMVEAQLAELDSQNCAKDRDRKLEFYLEGYSVG